MSEMKSIEDMMDMSLDDLKDLPAFEIPPKGHYKLAVSLQWKEVNEKRCIEAGFVVLETLELANANDAPCATGTKFSTLFQLSNEFGEGAFKELMKPMKDSLGLAGKKLSAIVETVQDITIHATVKHRQDKNDKERFYANVVNVELA